MSSSDRIILITGGNRGLGFAYAESLLSSSKASDYTIIITARTEEAAKTAARKLSGQGQVVGYGCDIEVERQVEGLRSRVERDFGRVDVLINNAGQYHVPHVDSEFFLGRSFVSLFFETQGRYALTMTLLELRMFRCRL